ncbi:MAG: EFR1 family ferrodoxin [bacterium]|nr:EFR1 family ferrodoxin [bacterium]
MLWYSQTGHTARIGKLIAKTLEGEGLAVESGPMAETEPAQAAGYDLLVFGAPVYYMDVPANVKKWLARLPDLSGIAAASWATYGGAGDNPFNTACGLLEPAAGKKAVPVGMETFGNMSTFSPTWSALGQKARILKYRDLPNEQTYEKGRRYARALLQRVREKKPLEVKRGFSISGALTTFNPMWWTKRMINRHEIDPAKCIRCFACAKTCPAGAISPDQREVDRGACLACMGCINNCPADAITMEYLGRPVYGWKRFCRENGIVIAEPRELVS